MRIPSPSEPTRRGRRSPSIFLRPARSLCIALGALLLAALSVPRARCETRWLLQGVADAEYWNTDGGSVLLDRNDGRAASAEGLRVWGAWEPFAGAQVFTRVGLEAGKGSEEGKSDVQFELAFVRYTWGSQTRVMVQAGRIGRTFGNFAKRYLPSANPLIGEPGGYVVSYPDGAEIAFWRGPINVSFAAVNRPLLSGDYLPKPTSSARPAASVAWAPMAGLRMGVYGTTGTYLSRDANPILPAGTTWRDFKERAWGFELQWSRGYFELNADITMTRYDVPTFGVPAHGRSYYIEPKYTWTPRFFTAIRIEQVRQPYIEIEDGDEWENGLVRFADVELGAGYRVAPGILVKASYRIDRWRVEEEERPEFPKGRALAVQLSYTFDVDSWLAPRH